jgi:alkylation response protein AidB-like acyl-CoA dehydrogenase
LPIASTDEQLALQASIREWAKRAAVIDVVRGLEPDAGGHHGVATARGDGPAAERWASLAELGVFGIGLPVAAGGADGSTADEFLLTRCLSIAGGTTQILLSLVAERQLGLPREEMR